MPGPSYGMVGIWVQQQQYLSLGDEEYGNPRKKNIFKLLLFDQAPFFFEKVIRMLQKHVFFVFTFDQIVTAFYLLSFFFPLQAL